MKNNQILILVLGVLVPVFTSGVHAGGRRPEPTARLSSDYDVAEGERVKIPARPAELPVYVYGHPTGEREPFVPSGYMGDGSALQKVTSVYDPSAPVSTGRSNKTSLTIRYLPKGREGWAGLYWQTPANNWGKIKGAGFDLSGSEKLTFWIRGEKGGERVAEVKVGGISGPYPDSDSVSIGPLVLSKDWEQYTVSLEGKDLRHIVGGFAIIFRRADNPHGATVFLDEVKYWAPKAESVPEMAEAVPETKTKAASPPVQDAPEPARVQQLSEAFQKTVLFSSAKAGFLDQGKSDVDEFIEKSKAFPNAPILVEGHTDNLGAAATNKKLSLRRAETVKDYLVEKGLSLKRISVVGIGEARPAASNNTEEGRRKNRRVELKLLPG